MDKDIIQKNRAYLHSVTGWITEDDYINSRGHYGCPRHALPLLNLPLDEQPTYTDLLVYAAAPLPSPVCYLELGVSVGKNFFVMANALHNATLIGFDWERINPTLERRLEAISTEGRLRWYRYGTNRVGYLQGDIACMEDWAQLAGRQFNLILSDACHQPDMLRQEYAMMERFGLIDATAAMIVWDDLDRHAEGPVTQAFIDICARLSARNGASSNFRVELNGWLGQHEHRHTVGVWNNIGLTQHCVQ